MPDMCEYSPDCDKVTDPLAKALSKNPREADAACLVLCPPRKHRLGVIYDVPQLGGLALVTPHFKVRHGSWGEPESVEDPAHEVHWHATITPIAEIPTGELWHGRCRCGTWGYKPAETVEIITADREGRLETGGDLVKVRGANGKIGRVGRSFAERQGMEIVGRVVRSARTQRPYIMGNYTKMADADTRGQE